MEIVNGSWPSAFPSRVTNKKADFNMVKICVQSLNKEEVVLSALAALNEVLFHEPQIFQWNFGQQKRASYLRYEKVELLATVGLLIFTVLAACS